LPVPELVALLFEIETLFEIIGMELLQYIPPPHPQLAPFPEVEAIFPVMVFPLIVGVKLFPVKYIPPPYPQPVPIPEVEAVFPVIMFPSIVGVKPIPVK